MLLVDRPGLGQTSVALGGPGGTLPHGQTNMLPFPLCSQVLLVDRPGLGQASVALGEPGVSLSDPDSPALDVLTSVLNNFGGRLFNQIRSREVLAGTIPDSLHIPLVSPELLPQGAAEHAVRLSASPAGLDSVAEALVWLLTAVVDKYIAAAAAACCCRSKGQTQSLSVTQSNAILTARPGALWLAVWHDGCHRPRRPDRNGIQDVQLIGHSQSTATKGRVGRYLQGLAYFVSGG